RTGRLRNGCGHRGGRGCPLAAGGFRGLGDRRGRRGRGCSLAARGVRGRGHRRGGGGRERGPPPGGGGAGGGPRRAGGGARRGRPGGVVRGGDGLRIVLPRQLEEDQLHDRLERVLHADAGRRDRLVERRVVPVERRVQILDRGDPREVALVELQDVRDLAELD